MGSRDNRSPPTDLIQSVSRALRVLEQVTWADRPLPVKVIARQCELNLSTAYHLVRTLSYEGYLVRHADGCYAVGPQVVTFINTRDKGLRKKNVPRNKKAECRSAVSVIAD